MKHRKKHLMKCVIMGKYSGSQKWKGQSKLMTENARKANSKYRPDGFVYILKQKGFKIYKIGVSASLERRIKDIDGANPFGTELIQKFWFKNAYNMEEAIHDSFRDNLLRKEWFKLSDEELENLCFDLSNLEKEGYYLIRK